MSQFTTALVVSPLSDGKSWVVLNDFKYHVGTENSGDLVIVDKGFVTDFTSVPRLFWLIIPRWGKYGNAAVIHDWLYWEQGEKDRKEADSILLEAMSVLGVSKWKKKTSYTKYESTLKLLVEHDCLTERLPEISMMYIDLDAILSYNKRGSQEWNFSRIRQLEKLLDNASITNRIYMTTKEFHNKIDEEAVAIQWEKDNVIEIIDKGGDVNYGMQW